jgi:hypothetical protein
VAKAAIPLLALGAALLAFNNPAGAAGAAPVGAHGTLAPVAAGARGHLATGTAAAGTAPTTVRSGQGHRLTAAEMKTFGLDTKLPGRRGVGARALSSDVCFDILSTNGGTSLPGVTINSAGGYQYVVWCGDQDTARLTAVEYQCIVQITNPSAGAACTGENILGGFNEEFFEYRTDWLLCDPSLNCSSHFDDVVYEYNGAWTTISRQ